MLSIGSVGFGLLLDRAGPRITAVSGLLMSVLGNSLMGYAHSELLPGERGDIAKVVGLSLIAAGGIAPYLSNMNIANLYPSPGLFVAANTLLFNVAGCIYIFLNIPSKDGMHLWLFFRCYAGLAALGAFAAFATYPDVSYKPGDEVRLPFRSWCKGRQDGKRVMDNKQVASTSNDVVEEEEKSLEEGLIGEKAGAGRVGEVEDDAWKVLLRADIIFLALFYAILLSLNGYLSGTLPDILNDLGDDKSNPEDLYTIYIYPLSSNALFPLILNPLVGHHIDKYGFITVFLLCVASAQAFCILTLTDSLPLQLVTFFVRSLLCATLIPGFFLYLTHNVPPACFGTVLAAITGIAAIINFGTIPLAAYSGHSGDYRLPALGLCFVCTPLYFFPCFLKQKEQHEPRLQEEEQSNSSDAVLGPEAIESTVSERAYHSYVEPDYVLGSKSFAGSQEI